MRTFILVVAMAIAGCAAPVPSLQIEDVQREILEAERRERDGWAARDVETIMDAYTADALVMAAGAPVREGPALREFFERVLTDPGFTLTFRSDPPIVAQSLDLGVATGTYSMTYTNRATGEVERVDGYHLLTWVKDTDGVWRIRRQLTGPSPPDTAPAAP